MRDYREGITELEQGRGSDTFYRGAMDRSAVRGRHGRLGPYLRVFVSQLRKKIEPESSHPRYVATEPWIGYRFVMPEKL